MLPTFLIPESTIREDGAGPVVPLGPAQGKLLMLTLAITRIIEQESLEVSVWGSPDGKDWGSKALLVLPQKFYCGVYRFLLDLSHTPGGAIPASPLESESVGPRRSQTAVRRLDDSRAGRIPGPCGWFRLRLTAG
jgi:hypothetical protein